MGMTLTKAVWLIGIHSIVHGIFGLIWVNSTHYVNYKPVLIHVFNFVFIFFILLGLATFFIFVFRRPMFVRVMAALFMLLALAYLIVGIIYFATYLPFYANSIFDSFFNYNDLECWVGPDSVVTFWHLITFLLLLLAPLWIFYGFLLCKLAHCVCCLPCPPLPCDKLDTCVPKTMRPCCPKEKLFYRIFKPKSCVPPIRETCEAPVPPCAAPCSTPCSKVPPPCPPCSPCPKKNAKFVLTLRPGKVLCK